MTKTRYLLPLAACASLCLAGCEGIDHGAGVPVDDGKLDSAAASAHDERAPLTTLGLTDDGVSVVFGPFPGTADDVGIGYDTGDVSSVEVVYTTDGWNTAQAVQLVRGDKQFEATIGAGGADSLEILYALRIRDRDGRVFWLNNRGLDYRATLPVGSLEAAFDELTGPDSDQGDLVTFAEAEAFAAALTAAGQLSPGVARELDRVLQKSLWAGTRYEAEPFPSQTTALGTLSGLLASAFPADALPAGFQLYRNQFGLTVVEDRSFSPRPFTIVYTTDGGNNVAHAGSVRLEPTMTDPERQVAVLGYLPPTTIVQLAIEVSLPDGGVERHPQTGSFSHVNNRLNE